MEGKLVLGRVLIMVPLPPTLSVTTTKASRRTKGDRISIWTKDKDDRGANVGIGQMVLVMLEEYSRDVQVHIYIYIYICAFSIPSLLALLSSLSVY